MAKKRRKKSVSSIQPRSFTELYQEEGERIAPTDQEPEVEKKPATKAKPTLRSSDSVDWKSEYTDVFGDLRYLLIVSTVLFLLMIVIGLVV